MKKAMIKLSVLISVCNNDNPFYLREAVRSIYHQTCKPQEIVLVVDGHIDEILWEEVEDLKKETVCSFKIVKIPNNVGLGEALNAGIKECSYEWIARMDSDDISREDRFEKQLNRLTKEPKIDVIGSYIEERDEKMDRILGVRKVPLSNNDITGLLGWKNPMNHVSVMFRKSSVMAVGGYPQELRKLQDYGLWAKMIKSGYMFKNIPECLVFVRTGKNFLERRGGMSYFRYEVAVLKYLKKSGHIGFIVFSAGVVTRFFTRISPISVRSLVYRAIRRF